MRCGIIEYKVLTTTPQNNRVEVSSYGSQKSAMFNFIIVCKCIDSDF